MSTVQEQSNKATYRRFCDAANTGDAELISKTFDELVEPDAPIRTPLPIETTRVQALKEVFAKLHRVFSDLQITVEDLRFDVVISRFGTSRSSESLPCRTANSCSQAGYTYFEQRGGSMVTGISIVAVPVDDIDEAVHFFCEALGMEKRKDLTGTDRYAGERYVEVAPPGSPVALSPYTDYDRAPGRATIGEYSRLVLRVADVHHAYTELSARGVPFETEPFDLPHGTFAAIRDPWDNVFGLTDSTTF